MKRFALKDGDVSIAGQYEGLDAGILYKNLLMLEDNYNSTDEKSDILDCECGCYGCWPITIEITALPHVVTWRSFEPHHRPNWDFTNFGEFSFDRKNYEGELEKLRKYT